MTAPTDYLFPEGSKYFFSNTFASAKTVSAASNADPAVLTSAGHGFVDGDELLFLSGWSDASNRVYKADQLSTDTLSPLGLDTSDTGFYAPGGGAGTLQKVSSWLELDKILGVSTSGGDIRYTDINPVNMRNGMKVPTGFNASSIEFTLGYNPSGANVPAMLKVSRGLKTVAFKITIAGGGSIYGYGYLAVSEVPAISANSPLTIKAAMTLLNTPISYA